MSPPQTMASTHGSSARVDDSRVYFFLSYAQTPPILGKEGSPADVWVSTFYNDLSERVAGLTGASPNDVGFIDASLRLSGDWKERLASALGAAEVFVPLYSPSYVSRSWPLSELASFRRRLDLVSPQRAAGHIQPVLWVPVAPSVRDEGLVEALELGEGVPGYAANGLGAMCRLTIFREEYQTILIRLAERIVSVAETLPLGESGPVTLTDEAVPEPGPTPFMVAVVAPTTVDLPSGRQATAYGSRSTGWRPFASAQAIPVVEWVEHVAQRLGLGTMIVDAGRDLDWVEQSPGIVLLDPWILATRSGRLTMRTLVAGLRHWTIPVVLVDENDPQYASRGEALAAEMIDMLGKDKVHVAKYARGESEFVQLTPTVVTLARRRFLSRVTRTARLRPRLSERNVPPTGQAPSSTESSSTESSSTDDQ